MSVVSVVWDQVALETDSQWEEELDKMQQEFALESDRQLNDIERLNNQVLALEKENAVLKDSTLMGEKQREVDLLKKVGSDKRARGGGVGLG